MKIKNCVTALIALSGAGTLLMSPIRPAMAQGAVTATGNGTFYVELKDATLFDAIQMILKAAGNPVPYIVDESAKSVNIGSTTLPNTKWDSAILNLVRVNNFLIRPNPDGTKVVEPRTPPPMEMGEMGGFPGGFPGAPGMPGGLPGNPFGGGAPGGFPAPAIRQYNNQQTAPALGTGAAGAEEPIYQLLPVRHVYVGGIAKLFGDAEIISTIDFLVPDSALQGSNGGGGLGGGGGGLGGGFGGGGGMGGFGGSIGGGLGGGFGGGMGGGMGGMGGGMGGMGGGMGGGFGGGGFGGGGIGGGIGGF